VLKHGVALGRRRQLVVDALETVGDGDGALDISLRTIQRAWLRMRAWLQKERR
jgi:hypothetical protein